MDFRSPNRYSALLEINRQFLGDERWEAVGRRMAAESGANARKKLLNAERFGDVVVGARIESDNFIALGVADSQHYDGRIAGTADFAASFDSAHSREIYVEKNQVRFELAGNFDSLFP